MGNGCGTKVLRFVVCALSTILVILFTAPKRVSRPAGPRAANDLLAEILG